MGYHHIALAVTDLAATHAFYTEAMGFELVKAVVGPTDDKVTVTIDVPLNSNGWIAPKFTKNKSIHATSTLKTERPLD